MKKLLYIVRIGKNTVRIAIALASFAFTAPAFAAPIVDVTTFCCNNGGEGIIASDVSPFITRRFAQTFTTVNTGTLTSLDLLIRAGSAQSEANLDVYLFSFTGELPMDLSAAQTATVSVSFSRFPSHIINVSGFSLPVTANEMIAFILEAELQPGEAVGLDAGTTSFAYAGGEGWVSAFLSPTLDGAWSGNNRDLMFRTYVDCADETQCTAAADPVVPEPPRVIPLPEPSSLLLLGCGIAGAAATKSRRRIHG
jgi:hypothetical protein